MRTWILLFVAVTSAAAQPLRFGVKAGMPLTDFFSTVQNQTFSLANTSKQYVIGPSLELKLPLGFGIEFDALYRRLSYNGGSLLPTTSENVTGNAWEFPLLAKYRFPTPVVRPFVDAGIAWDTLSGVKQSVLTSTGLSNAPVATKTTKGFVMGGGVEIHALIIRISPEIRYTHWGSARFVDPLNLVTGSQNQAEFLLGITF